MVSWLRLTFLMAVRPKLSWTMFRLNLESKRLIELWLVDLTSLLWSLILLVIFQLSLQTLEMLLTSLVRRERLVIVILTISLNLTVLRVTSHPRFILVTFMLKQESQTLRPRITSMTQSLFWDRIWQLTRSLTELFSKLAVFPSKSVMPNAESSLQSWQLLLRWTNKLKKLQTWI